METLEHAGMTVLTSGGDTWWNPPYGKIPSVAYKLISQTMFATRFAWPVATAENTVLLARRA